MNIGVWRGNITDTPLLKSIRYSFEIFLYTSLYGILVSYT